LALIQIKSSNVTAVPSTLNIAEPAYSYASNTLFIGTPAGTGSIAIGGKFYLDQQQTIYNTANAAFTQANSSTGSLQTTLQNNINTVDARATAAFIQANAAFIKANTGTGNASFGDYFPTGDWGNLTDAASSAFGEDLTVMYDCRVDPITPRGYLLSKDFGYVA